MIQPGYLLRERGREWFVRVNGDGHIFSVQTVDGKELPRALGTIPVFKMEQRINAFRSLEAQGVEPRQGHLQGHPLPAT